MKHAILRNVGSALLIGGLAFALPVYAAEHGAPGTMDGKGGVMGASEAQQMSGMMGKGTMNDADRLKQMDQMRKQMDDLRQDMPAAPAKK